jgi:hypothetical protein
MLMKNLINPIDYRAWLKDFYYGSLKQRKWRRIRTSTPTMKLKGKMGSKKLLCTL